MVKNVLRKMINNTKAKDKGASYAMFIFDVLLLWTSKTYYGGALTKGIYLVSK